MQDFKESGITISGLIFNSLKLLIVGLLLFGNTFTKINVAGPLFLYDTLLILLAFIAALTLKRVTEKRMLLFLILSLFYLAFSFVFNDAFIYVIRQYMIVGYLLLTYFIFQSIVGKTEALVSFIFTLSKWSFILQIVYSVYILTKGNSLFGDFNYLSPISVMLLPIYAARVITHTQNTTFKGMQLVFILFLSTTLGHSSAFLAVSITIFGFFVFKINRKQLIIALSIIAIVLVSFYLFLPQFRDANASWRLFYWGKAIEKTAESYFLGNGFGVPFINEKEIYDMVVVFGDDNDLLGSPKEKYIKAYHNSFITLFYHMGICILLLAAPFIKSFRYLKSKQKNPMITFLVLGLLGSSTWCFFNVILELPHSSILCWLLFLLTSHYLKTRTAV